MISKSGDKYQFSLINVREPTEQLNNHSNSDHSEGLNDESMLFEKQRKIDDFFLHYASNIDIDYDENDLNNFENKTDAK